MSGFLKSVYSLFFKASKWLKEFKLLKRDLESIICLHYKLVSISLSRIALNNAAKCLRKLKVNFF